MNILIHNFFMKNPPKKHHYVPECYLKSFVDYKNIFWYRNRNESKTKLTMPSKVCYEEDAYKIRTEETIINNQLKDFYDIERFAFRNHENNYQKLLNKIKKTQSSVVNFDVIEYKLFLEILLTIKRRNPTSRNTLISQFSNSYSAEESAQEFYDYLLEIEPEIIKKENLLEEIKSYLKNQSNNKKFLYDMYLSAYLNTKEYHVIENIIELFLNFNQFILISDSIKEFITSDNPGFTQIEDMLYSAGGFANNFEFYFPLTPNLCFYINSNKKNSNVSSKEILIHPLSISTDTVDAINFNTYQMCNKKTFALSKNSLFHIESKLH